jgi:hypothetical protein
MPVEVRPREGFIQRIEGFRCDTRGLSMIEYLVLLGCMALMLISAWRVFGRRIGEVAHHQAQVVWTLEADDLSHTGQASGAVDPLPPPMPAPGSPEKTQGGTSAAGEGAKTGNGAAAAGEGANQGTGPNPPPPSEARKVAERLVATGGTATAADRAAVLAEVEKLPLGALKALEKEGMKITVVKDSVVEALPALKGVKPRGWPPGSGWENVPGLYDPATKQVVIATRNGAVPATGNGHGSANLVIHETGHAIDAALNGNKDAAFQAARNKDLAKLPGYETQPGDAGLQESYAESLARYYGNPAASQATNPELHKYWATDPLDKKP